LEGIKASRNWSWIVREMGRVTAMQFNYYEDN
jgi:hypothetical protein